MRTLACALLGLVVVASADSVQHATKTRVQWDIILDAGSTGTRMYLFKSTFSTNAEGAEELNVITKKIGKKKPGLSAYADNPDAAAAPLLQLFKDVTNEIPDWFRARTPVSILGTAGMRSVDEEKQQPIYDSVRAGLLASDEYVFTRGELLKLRTIDGTEEGTFSLMCVNFLTGRLDHHLNPTHKGKKENLLGIVDLGGSSTQIAIPPTEKSGETKVRSYAAYGMEQMRERMDHLIHNKKMNLSPCYFKGYKDPTGYQLGGSGDATECRWKLQEILELDRKDCAPDDHECQPGHDDHAGEAGMKGRDFYAVSGYLYVQDFASHWLTRNGTGESTPTTQRTGARVPPPVGMEEAHALAEMPHQERGKPLGSHALGQLLRKVGNKPTIEELQHAAHMLCNSDWAEIEQAHAGGADAGAHRYTDSTKAPHRCLEINYVITLLQYCYGFPINERLVTFEDEIDGNDVEWPLGALLTMGHEHRLTGERDHHTRIHTPSRNFEL